MQQLTTELESAKKFHQDSLDNTRAECDRLHQAHVDAHQDKDEVIRQLQEQVKQISNSLASQQQQQQQQQQDQQQQQQQRQQNQQQQQQQQQNQQQQQQQQQQNQQQQQQQQQNQQQQQQQQQNQQQQQQQQNQQQQQQQQNQQQQQEQQNQQQGVNSAENIKVVPLHLNIEDEHSDRPAVPKKRQKKKRNIGMLKEHMGITAEEEY